MIIVTSWFAFIAWENYSLSINRKTRISDATQKCPERGRYNANQCLSSTFALDTSASVPKFPRTLWCQHHITEIQASQPGSHHQPHTESHSLPAALEENWLSIYLGVLSQCPLHSELHVCHKLSEICISLTENPSGVFLRFSKQTVMVCVCGYTHVCECIQSFKSLLQMMIEVYYHW